MDVSCFRMRLPGRSALVQAELCGCVCFSMKKSCSSLGGVLVLVCEVSV